MHTPSFIKYRTYIQTLTEIKPKFKSPTNTITNSFPKNVKLTSKIKKECELIKSLALNVNFFNELEENKKLKEQKINIDLNKDIKNKRLGIYKEPDLSISNKDIALNKISDSEKIVLIEKKSKELKKELNQKKIEYYNINEKINNILKEVEEEKIKIGALNNIDYFEHKLKTKENEEFEREKEFGNNERLKKKEGTTKEVMKSPEKIRDMPSRRGSMLVFKDKETKQAKFSHMNRILAIKQALNPEIEKTNEKILKLQDVKELYENDKKYIKTKINELKYEVNIVDKEIIKYYHLRLYEGMDFRGDGLITMILAIWNLGFNVDKSYFPSYLDKNSVKFLFNKAKQYIELTKLKQLLKNVKKEFVEDFHKWNKSNKNFNKSSFSHKKTKKIKNNDDNEFDLDLFHSRKNLPLDNKNNFFKTKISDKYQNSNNHLLSNLFMSSYETIMKNENEDIETKLTIESSKKIELPDMIVEKNNLIEDLEKLIKKKQNLMVQNTKNEVIRLTKEFINNNYEEKYNVDIETIFGALFGEANKVEQLIYYNQLEKEYKDNQKLIKFYSLLKSGPTNN